MQVQFGAIRPFRPDETVNGNDMVGERERLVIHSVCSFVADGDQLKKLQQAEQAIKDAESKGDEALRRAKLVLISLKLMYAKRAKAILDREKK